MLGMANVPLQIYTSFNFPYKTLLVLTVMQSHHDYLYTVLLMLQNVAYRLGYDLILEIYFCDSINLINFI